MKKNIYDSEITHGIGRVLVSLGKFFSTAIPSRWVPSLLFFFPYYHVGGAERVHADIVCCFDDLPSWVFFTHRSKDDKFKPLFGVKARLFNVWWLMKYTLPLSIGFVAGLINKQASAIVFGCSSRFFYKMLPFLRPQVRCIDLLHAFGGGGEHFSLPAVTLLDARVVINRRTIEDFRSQYSAHGVDLDYLDRIVLIENKIDIPSDCPVKPGGRLQVLYVGRGAEEKRVHIAGRTATLTRESGCAADFRFAGDLAASIRPADLENCILLGEIRDSAALAKVYDEAHVLILTSSREGFPVVIMEAMAHGVVPICTNVGGIPEHVIDGENGILVDEVDEEAIASRIAATVAGLAADPKRLQEMSTRAHRHALAHFSGRDFCCSYRELFFGRDGTE